MNEYIIELPDKPFKIVRDGWNVRVEWDYKQREEIVRCKDCKYMSKDTNVFKWCYRLSPEFACEPDGFCAWGKRRE